MKHRTHEFSIDSEAVADVTFCLNCDDIDDLALRNESRDIDAIHRRFENCAQTGHFDGDMCSRIFIAEDRIDTPDVFSDETG